MITAPTTAGPVTRAPSIQAVDDDVTDLVELWGIDSFPASDPPANW